MSTSPPVEKEILSIAEMVTAPVLSADEMEGIMLRTARLMQRMTGASEVEIAVHHRSLICLCEASATSSGISRQCDPVWLVAFLQGEDTFSHDRIMLILRTCDTQHTRYGTVVLSADAPFEVSDFVNSKLLREILRMAILRIS